MTDPRSSDRPRDAAEWDARLRAPDCSEAERSAFEAWCRASPEHRASFDELQMLLGGLRAAGDVPEIRAMREAAINASAGKPKNRAWRWSAAAAVAVLAIGLGIFGWLHQSTSVPPAEVGFATSIGERSTTTLEDGSIAVLNTNTRMEPAFSAAERRVVLLRGQALFDVSKDPARPFVVVAGERRITAVGTVFDVRYDGSDVEVTMVEGVVEVAAEVPLGTHLTPPATEPRPVRINAGQVLKTSAVATPAAPVVQSVDADRATLWREGRVFFDDAPLSEAVREMNRYSQIQILVDGKELDRYRINGMFRTGRQTTFVDAVESYFPIYAERHADNRIVLKPRQEE